MQKGFAHILVLILLVVGLLVALYLVQHPAIFKPKAFDNSIAAVTTDNGYPFGKAIKLVGNTQNPQYVKVGFQTVNPSPNFTAEAWIKPLPLPATRVNKPPTTYEIISNNWGYASPSVGSFSLYMNSELKEGGFYSYRYDFTINTASPECYIDSNTIVTVYRQGPFTEAEFTAWKHVAAVVDEGQLRIYENGKLIGKNDNIISSFCVASTGPQIGAFLSLLEGQTNFFQGLIDELRVSSISRYKNDFVVSNQPFAHDDSTILLYHFDGNANDASGLSYKDGMIVGSVEFVELTPFPTPAPITWTGKYYTYLPGDASKGLNGTPVLIRQDSEIKFNWGNGSPAANIPGDRFSARWTRTENVPAGTYLITVRHDDGMRIFFDGIRLYDRWSNQTASTRTFTKALSTGVHILIVEYYESQNLAEAQVTWIKQ